MTSGEFTVTIDAKPEVVWPWVADLSKHVVFKYTPHLVFHLDDSIERGARVLEILQEIEPPPSAENK